MITTFLLSYSVGKDINALLDKKLTLFFYITYMLIFVRVTLLHKVQRHSVFASELVQLNLSCISAFTRRIKPFFASFVYFSYKITFLVSLVYLSYKITFLVSFVYFSHKIVFLLVYWNDATCQYHIRFDR